MNWNIYVSVTLLLILIIKSYSYGNPINEEKELTNELNCKTLCGNCGYMGFYCGQECICEINNDNKGDLECISKMQNNCKKSMYPFEVLIQGTCDDNFFKNVLKTKKQNNKETEIKLHLENRNKRHTFVIYKPNENIPNISNTTIMSLESLKSVNLQLPEEKRTKRGLNNFKRLGFGKEYSPNFLRSVGKRNINSLKNNNNNNNNNNDDEDDWFNDSLPKQQKLKNSENKNNNKKNIGIHITKKPITLPFLRKTREQNNEGVISKGIQETINQTVTKFRELLSAFQEKAEKIISAATSPTKFQIIPNVVRRSAQQTLPQPSPKSSSISTEVSDDNNDLRPKPWIIGKLLRPAKMSY